MSNMRTEQWCGYDIRFIEINGEWYAILKDICDASQIIGKDIGRKPGDNKTRWMLAVNESGIYEALFASRRLEARKFRRWAGTVMQKLRKSVGLEGYEVMRMTEPEIQDQIDDVLDTLFWDDEKKMLMRSVTIQGGDVETQD